MPLSPDLLAVLACPESKAPLLYFADGEDGKSPDAAFLFCPTSRLRYRIEGDIPVLLVEEAERISEAAERRWSRAPRVVRAALSVDRGRVWE